MMVFVYGVAEQQIGYGNDIAQTAMLVGLGALQFGTGFAWARWWALLLPPATVILAMPAGYPDSNKGEPVTASTGLLVLSHC